MRHQGQFLGAQAASSNDRCIADAQELLKHTRPAAKNKNKISLLSLHLIEILKETTDS